MCTFVSFLFKMIDPAGSGQLCQGQVSGRPGAKRELDEETVLFFLEKFFVLEDDTIDIVLGAAERYFGLAPATHVKRGDGRMVPGAQTMHDCVLPTF